MAEAPRERVPVVSALCLLEGDAFRTRDYVLREIRAACSERRQDLVVTPFLPFVQFREGAESEELADLIQVAREHRTYLAVALVEQRKEGGRSHTALLLDRQGRIVGRYRQTHAFPDDDGLVLGDDLPVFQTEVGAIGLSVGSDFYFPEVYWVERMKGAEILVWQHAPERLRQHFEWTPLLKARALDNLAHLVAAGYADPRAYITNSYSGGMPGAPWGRSMILNRIGCPIADTGYDDGAATVGLRLDKRKQNVHQPHYRAENTFFVVSLGERTAFQPLTEAHRPAPRPAYRKRTARIAVGYLPREHMWHDGAVPERMLALIDEAAALQPDLLLLSEMGAHITDETTRRVAGLVSERARRMNAYIVIGGVGDERFDSIARVWDRDGREVFQAPLFWTRGFPELQVFDTDFARIGIHSCGDLYTGEIDRVLTVKGAELILDPSRMWGADGENNELLLRARAAENGCWVACAHWNSSDTGLRSVIVDPYGGVVAASRFQQIGLIATEVDFDDAKVYYAGRKADQPKPGGSGMASYFTGDLPEQKRGWREMVLSRRRPELYGILPAVNEVILKYRSAK
ncbi:MAG: carbon-nitrogen hydrolase family protein [Armatimonadetes bacterium]|nr:carbon-nitrogen hydrolase family protein [Armatimonadota bacterium]